MPSIASGRRATIEMARMRSAPGLEISVFMSPMLGTNWYQWKIQSDARKETSSLRSTGRHRRGPGIRAR